jgi:ketosteroid isomerase-like protein
MKLRLAGWVFVGVLLLSWRAGATEMVGPERQILSLVREWVDAETNRDEATLRRILDDRIVATFGTGQPFGKEDYVKAVMAVGKSKMLGHDLREQAVVVEGDTAVEVGTDAMRFVTEGVESISTYRYTTTYIKRGDRWTVLAVHMVKLPPEKG